MPTLEEKFDALNDKFHAIDIAQVQIGNDVAHIKGRIDNGMSKTLANINDNFNRLIPKIEHHASIIKRIEDIGWWISKSISASLVVALVGVVVWAASRGFKL